MPILDAGIIYNEQPSAGALNPHETHFYEHQVKHSPPPHFCEHVSWVIVGDIPKSISIDASSGVISGTLCHFGKQPSCQSNKPKEKPVYDGKNFANNGRFKPDLYDFHFTVIRNTLVSGPNPSTGAMDCAVKIPFVETSNVYIRLVKNQDIDNLIFLEDYIDNGIPSEESGEETSINVNGKVYTTSSSARRAHPGPFLDLNC